MAARKRPPVTSSRTRADRSKNTGKAPTSKPSPRQTAAGGRGAQQGPLKPGTRTSGSGMVNANKPYMQRIQAKATELRQQTARGVRASGQRATTLPNSARAGRNLIKEGAQRLRTIGDSGQIRAAAQRGKDLVKAAQAARGAKQAMKNMSGTLAKARFARGPASVAASIAAEKTLGPAATKLGERLGKGPLTRLGRAIDRVMPGVNSKDEARLRRAAATKAGPAAPARIAKAPKAPKLPSANESTATAFDRAFKSARQAGKKEFTWRGKRYTTKMK